MILLFIFALACVCLSNKSGLVALDLTPCTSAHIQIIDVSGQKASEKLAETSWDGTKPNQIAYKDEHKEQDNREQMESNIDDLCNIEIPVGEKHPNIKILYSNRVEIHGANLIKYNGDVILEQRGGKTHPRGGVDVKNIHFIGEVSIFGAPIIFQNNSVFLKELVIGTDEGKNEEAMGVAGRLTSESTECVFSELKIQILDPNIWARCSVVKVTGSTIVGDLNIGGGNKVSTTFTHIEIKDSRFIGSVNVKNDGSDAVVIYDSIFEKQLKVETNSSHVDLKGCMFLGGLDVNTKTGDIDVIQSLMPTQPWDMSVKSKFGTVTVDTSDIENNLKYTKPPTEKEIDFVIDDIDESTTVFGRLVSDLGDIRWSYSKNINTSTHTIDKIGDIKLKGFELVYGVPSYRRRAFNSSHWSGQDPGDLSNKIYVVLMSVSIIHNDTPYHVTQSASVHSQVETHKIEASCDVSTNPKDLSYEMIGASGLCVAYMIFPTSDPSMSSFKGLSTNIDVETRAIKMVDMFGVVFDSIVINSPLRTNISLASMTSIDINTSQRLDFRNSSHTLRYINAIEHIKVVELTEGDLILDYVLSPVNGQVVVDVNSNYKASTGGSRGINKEYTRRIVGHEALFEDWGLLGSGNMNEISVEPGDENDNEHCTFVITDVSLTYPVITIGGGVVTRSLIDIGDGKQIVNVATTSKAALISQKNMEGFSLGLRGCGSSLFLDTKASLGTLSLDGELRANTLKASKISSKLLKSSELSVGVIVADKIYGVRDSKTTYRIDSENIVLVSSQSTAGVLRPQYMYEYTNGNVTFPDGIPTWYFPEFDTSLQSATEGVPYTLKGTESISLLAGDHVTIAIPSEIPQAEGPHPVTTYSSAESSLEEYAATTNTVVGLVTTMVIVVILTIMIDILFKIRKGSNKSTKVKGEDLDLLESFSGGASDEEDTAQNTTTNQRKGRRGKMVMGKCSLDQVETISEFSDIVLESDSTIVED